MIATTRHNCTMADSIASGIVHPEQRWVACLCAAWCSACREYQPLFDAVAALHPGLHFAWIDIEDHAELVGELDIETFPTVLVGDHASLLFAGPVLPHTATLSRLLESLSDASAMKKVEPELGQLVQALYRKFSSV
jgi:thioredoxin 1